MDHIESSASATRVSIAGSVGEVLAAGQGASCAHLWKGAHSKTKAVESAIHATNIHISNKNINNNDNNNNGNNNNNNNNNNKQQHQQPQQQQ